MSSASERRVEGEKLQKLLAEEEIKLNARKVLALIIYHPVQSYYIQSIC